MRLVHFLHASVQGVVLLLGMSLRIVPPSVVGATVSWCGLTSVVRAADAITPKRNYHLPRGEAAVTLRQFATASGTPVLFMMDKVQGERTSAVEGEYTPVEALKQMLAGTSLEIVTANDSTGFMIGRRNTSAMREVAVRGQNQQPPHKQMSPKSVSSNVRSWLAHAALAVATVATAQQTPNDASKPASPDELVTLSPFVVSSSGVAGYQMGESTAGGRVRASTFETTQPVTVVTRSLIDDVGTSQVLDALKYVAGITQSSQSVGADRIEVRGFQVSNTGLIDGFQTGGLNHQDAALFDRFEVVKGPNAIISPAGAPGGTVNLVTKSPQFGKNTTTAQLEVGRYDSNRANLDVNRTISNSVAARLVIAGQRDDGYYHNYEHNFAAIAGLTWRFGQNSELTVKYLYQWTKDQNFVGIPIDPTADTSTADPQPYPGLARDANIFNPDDIRSSQIKTYEALYTLKVAEGLSTRLAGQYNHENSWFNQFDTGLTGPAQGDYNPLTGAFVYGVLFNKTAPYGVSGPAATPTPIYQRTTSGPRRLFGHVYRTAFQNDWVYEVKNDLISSQTSAGFAYNDDHVPHGLSLFLIRSSANPTNGLDTFNIFGPYTAPISGTILGRGPRSDNSTDTTTRQLYANEVLKFFKNRLILNGGVSQSWFKYHLVDRVSPARTYDTSFRGDLQKTYGVVIEPLPDTAVYYGHSEVTNFSSAGLPPAPQTQDSKSDEIGVRQKLLGGRATVTVDYFDTTQNNFSVPNPANLDPARLGLPSLPNLFSDRQAHGWEFEFNGAITNELSVVANYTKFKNRDANNVVFRGTAERSGALWIKYDFKNGQMKGFGIGLGINYLDRRPGDNPRAGFTSASTPTQPVYYQPTYWIPARTLADLTLSYKVNAHWSARFIVNNLLDEEYIDSALNRQELELGGDRNYRFQATYTF